jgi:hypothetical protein
MLEERLESQEEEKRTSPPTVHGGIVTIGINQEALSIINQLKVG